MKHKRLKATILTTALALSMASMAMADPTTPGPEVNADPNSEYNKNKDTTISIITSSLPDFNISYTVPLYVTMAVASQNNEVKTPDNYDFINTTPENNSASVDVGVTSMSFEKLTGTGASYYTVATAGAIADIEADKDKIYLTIGSEPMPAIAASDTAKIKTWVPSAASVFTKNDASGPEPIHSNARVNLPITGKVAKVDRVDAATAAQFRVKYTVSVLSAGGQTLGGVYAGSNRVEAGLGDWTLTN